MKRKVSLLTALIMLCSLLTVGCNRVPTAQELVDNAFASMSQDKADITMEMYMEMSAEADFLGETVTMDVTMGVNADMQTTKEVSHISGDVEMEMFGMTIDQPMDVYTDMTDGVMYSLTEDVWYKENVDNGSQPTADELEAVRSDSFVDLVLVEEEEGKESTEWVVTGLLDYSKLMEVMGEDLLSSLDSGVNTEALAELQLQVVMTFDKETQALKTMSCTCDEENLSKFEISGGSIDVLEFSFTFRDASNLVIEIPAEVKDSAVENTL